MNLRGRAVLLAGLMVLPGLNPAEHPLSAEEPATTTIATQPHETLDSLLAKINKPTASLEEKDAAVLQIMDLPEGPQHLVGQLNRMIIRELNLYKTRLAHAAEDAFKSHMKPETTAEIADLRAKVLSVSRGGGITKERIHDIADPAVSRLKEILLVTPKEIFDKMPALDIQLDGLLAEARWREMALEKTPPKLRKGLEGVIDTSNFAADLGDLAQAAAFAAIPMPNADQIILVEDAKRSASLEKEEARGIETLNHLRIIVGFDALLIDPHLCQAARDHSTEMKEKGYFSHESPTAALKTPWDRAKLAGTSAGGECIAAGTGSGDGAIDMWWNSPGHHSIIMSASTRIGLGRSDATWTLMTGG
jgi:uncharacterized protein YkwD